MSRFAEIANKVAADIERPKLAPAGIYELRVTNTPSAVAQSYASGSFEKVSFNLTGVNVVDVDDDAALAEAGGAAAIRVNNDFLFSLDPNEEANAAKNEFRLRTFLVDHLGLDGSLTIGQLMSIAKGSTCYGEISHRVDKDDDSILYYNLKKTMPVS